MLTISVLEGKKDANANEDKCQEYQHNKQQYASEPAPATAVALQISGSIGRIDHTVTSEKRRNVLVFAENKNKILCAVKRCKMTFCVQD